MRTLTSSPTVVTSPRGIFTTIVVKTKVALEEIVRMYEEYYAKDSFTHIVEKNIDLKQVVNTNKMPHPSGEARRQAAYHFLHR